MPVSDITWTSIEHYPYLIIGFVTPLKKVQNGSDNITQFVGCNLNVKTIASMNFTRVHFLCGVQFLYDRKSTPIKNGPGVPCTIIEYGPPLMEPLKR